MKLILAQPAYGAIQKDVLRHKDSETGGILLKKRIDGELIIPMTILGGPNSHRSWGGFSPDSDYQQQNLNFLFQRFGLDYSGDWHRHPGQYDRPSHTDWKQARQIVTDEAWNKLEAVFPIVVLNNCHIRTSTKESLVIPSDPRLR